MREANNLNSNLSLAKQYQKDKSAEKHHKTSNYKINSLINSLSLNLDSIISKSHDHHHSTMNMNSPSFKSQKYSKNHPSNNNKNKDQPLVLIKLINPNSTQNNEFSQWKPITHTSLIPPIPPKHALLAPKLIFMPKIFAQTAMKKDKLKKYKKYQNNSMKPSKPKSNKKFNLTLTPKFNALKFNSKTKSLNLNSKMINSMNKF